MEHVPCNQLLPWLAGANHGNMRYMEHVPCNQLLPWLAAAPGLDGYMEPPIKCYMEHPRDYHIRSGSSQVTVYMCNICII